MSAYLDAMRNYANFTGRTSREEYWRAEQVFVPLIIVAFAVLGIPFLEPASLWPALLFLLIVGSHAVPWTALMVRRLHDMDRAGWWALVALTPINIVMPWGLLALIVWGGFAGTCGPNRYGADPLGREPLPGQPATLRGGPLTSPSGTAGATAAASAAPRDVIAEIERLAQLRASGALSETEFEVMKAQALGGSGRA